METATSKAVVVGCGPSAHEWEIPGGVLSVGVNDAAGYVKPPRFDHLVVIDPVHRFTPERQKIISLTECGKFWYCDEKWLPLRGDLGEPVELVYVPMPKWDGNLDGPQVAGKMTSAIPAMHVAYKAGARDIGLIGVDLAPPHVLYDKKLQVQKWLAKFRKLLEAAGCRVVNLSPHTYGVGLTTIPMLDLESWLQSEPTAT